MRGICSVGWVCWGLLLAGVPTAMAQPTLTGRVNFPTYLKIESDTLVVGGVDDLRPGAEDLFLIPGVCAENRSTTRLGIGFVMVPNFSGLSVSGSIQAPPECQARIHIKSLKTGKCDLLETFKISGSSFLFPDLPLDSSEYQNPTTAEVELCLVIECTCAGVPTDRDAVSIEELTIGPTPN